MDSSVLGWATFVAAAVAAVGTLLAPFAAYRGVRKSIEADRAKADAAQAAADVARFEVKVAIHTRNALSGDAIIAAVGRAVLRDMLEHQQLTRAQRAEISAVLTGSLAKRARQIGVEPAASREDTEQTDTDKG